MKMKMKLTLKFNLCIALYCISLNDNIIDKWRPPSLSELTPIIFNIEMNNLGLDASKYPYVIIMKISHFHNLINYPK